MSKYFNIKNFFSEFPIGFNVKLNSAMAAILVRGHNCQTQFCRPPKHHFSKIWLKLEPWFQEKIFEIHPPFFLFLAWRPYWLEVKVIRHIFGRAPSKDNNSKVWLKSALWILRRRTLTIHPLFSIFSPGSHFVRSSETTDTIFIRGPPKDYNSKVWLKSVYWVLRRRTLKIHPPFFYF